MIPLVILLERGEELAAHAFVLPMHVAANDGEDDEFEEEVNPRLVDETSDVEGKSSCVESKDVGVFHQGSACVKKIFA